MKWCSQPHSFLAHDASRRSTPTRARTGRGAFRGKYLFVYPFVKTRAWYALDRDER